MDNEKLTVVDEVKDPITSLPKEQRSVLARFLNSDGMKDVKSALNGLLVAIVASRLQPGFNLPITDDGKSLKEVGLEGLGYRMDEKGDLYEISPDEKKLD